mgnify:CR=1 FL=1
MFIDYEKMLVTLNYSGKLHSPLQTMLEKTNMAKNYLGETSSFPNSNFIRDIFIIVGELALECQVKQ